MLPDHLQAKLHALNRLYPWKLEGYVHFYEAADPSPALITRCHMNFAFAYCGKVFVPVEMDQNGFWSFTDEHRRNATPEDLLALTECAVQELRLGWERYLEFCARIGQKPDVPEDWRKLKAVWTARRAILRDYAEDNSDTEDEDREAA